MTIENVAVADFSNNSQPIAVDTIGGNQFQVVKLAFGSDGSLTLADAANGIPVLVMAALPAGTNVIGKVDINNSIPAGANTIGAVTIATLPAGTNNIGDVDIASAIPAGTNNIGDVDIASAIPTGTNVIGKVGLDTGANLIGQVDLNSVPASSRGTDSNSVALATDAIMSNLTALTPKFAKANVTASSTDAAVVAAVTSKKIRVLSFRIHTAGTATNVTFNSKPAGAGTAISELFACGINGGRSEAFNPIGHFESASGEGLSLTTGAGSTVGVGVTYVEV